MSLQFSPITSPSPAPLVPSRQHSLLRKTPPSRATGLPSPRQRASTGYSSNGSSKSAPVSPNFRASSTPGMAPLSLISPIALTQELPDSRAPNGKDNYRPGLPRRSSSGNNIHHEAESSRAADARARAAQLEQTRRLQFMAQQQALFSQAQQQQHMNGSFSQQQQSLQHQQQQLPNQQQFRVHPSQPLVTRPLPRKSPGATQSTSQHSAYPFPNQHRARSRPRPDPGISSSESEYDSDVTAVPLGKTSANSKSQPDLVAFRKEAAHGWAAQQAAERERAKLQQPRVRTPSAGSYPATNGPSPSHFRPSPITIPSNGINRGQQVAAGSQGLQNGVSPSNKPRPLASMSPLQSSTDLSRSLSPLDAPGARAAKSPQTLASPGSLSRNINALSRSQPSLFTLRDPVPRNAPYNGFTGSTREATTTSLDSSPDIRRRRVVATGSDSGTSGGENDADDDWDATSASSPSSGSLTFSPKRTKHRPKGLEISALGLVGVDRGSEGDGGITTETETEGENGTLWSRREKLSVCSNHDDADL